MPLSIKKYKVETILFIYFVYFFVGGGGEVGWEPAIFLVAVVKVYDIDLFSHLLLALNLGLPVVSLQSRFDTSLFSRGVKSFTYLA